MPETPVITVTLGRGKQRPFTDAEMEVGTRMMREAFAAATPEEAFESLEAYSRLLTSTAVAVAVRGGMEPFQVVTLITTLMLHQASAMEDDPAAMNHAEAMVARVSEP